MLYRPKNNDLKGFDEFGPKKEIPNLKFLLVDDSIVMRRILINSLKQLDYNNFIETDDGETALAKLFDDKTINFVITDWNMPGISGFELVKKIRSNEKLLNLPILMVITRGMKDEISSKNPCINDYIIKPFTLQILKEKIDKVLSSYAFKIVAKEITKGVL